MGLLQIDNGVFNADNTESHLPSDIVPRKEFKRMKTQKRNTI